MVCCTLRFPACSVRTDMARIYEQSENCTRMEELLQAGLGALTDKFYGFAPTGELSGGDVIVMRRKR